MRALQAGIVEPAPLLALHNALMIAKIMRQEFPHDWYVAYLLHLEAIFSWIL